MNSTAWKNIFGTLPLQLQWRPCNWQDKHNYDCKMIAGVELEKKASGHEMSNQRQSENLMPTYYLFNSGLRVIGKTRVAPKTSKTTTWWVGSHSKMNPLAIKCQSDTTQHKAEDKLRNLSPPTTLQLHFFSLHNLCL